MSKFGLLDGNGHQICRLFVDDMAAFMLVGRYLLDMSGHGVANDGFFGVHDGKTTPLFPE